MAKESKGFRSKPINFERKQRWIYHASLFPKAIGTIREARCALVTLDGAAVFISSPNPICGLFVIGSSETVIRGKRNSLVAEYSLGIPAERANEAARD